MACLFKRKMRNGQRSAKWSIKIVVGGKVRWVAAYSDKRASQEKAASLQASIDRGETNLLDVYADHKAAPLSQHIADYISDLKTQGRDEMYIYNIRRHLHLMADDCGWGNTPGITSDSFIKWRQRHAEKLAPKTLNTYLSDLNAFCNWLVRQDRMARNPVANLSHVEQRGREVRVRRAYTDAEVQRLLDVTPEPRRTTYLLAVNTGLRKAELAALTWADIHLTAARPFISVRASIAKNHRTATLFLSSACVAALQAIRGTASETDKALHVPSWERFCNDQVAAGLATWDEKGHRKNKNAAGQQVDFHCFRTTCNTNLHRAGVNPAIVKTVMRHSDMRLSTTNYLDVAALPVADAVDALPVFTPSGDQQAANKAG